MTLIRTKTNRDGLHGLFDNLFAPEFPLGTSQNVPSGNSLPKVNILENDQSFQLELAAPGLEKSDIKIQLEHELLTISSEKKEEENKNKRYTKKEFSFQSFRRVFTLPELVDTDKIEANYHNGILLVTIPKKEEAKPQPPKSIQVG
jgi:HSP20 family protein